MHLDLDSMIPCHMDGSMSRYFLRMDNMSPDRLCDCDEESMEDGYYGGQYQLLLESLQSYRRSHGMLLIRAQWCTGWKGLAGTNWITAGEGSQPGMDPGPRWISPGEESWPEMDHGRRWIAAADGLRPELDDKRWTQFGDGLQQELDPGTYGSWPDMDGWLEVDDRRWISGDGSLETEDNRSLSYMKILRLCETMRFSRSRLWFWTTHFLWNRDMHLYNKPAAWLHQVRYRALSRDEELDSYKAELQCWIRSRIRSGVTVWMPIPHKPCEINLW